MENHIVVSRIGRVSMLAPSGRFDVQLDIALQADISDRYLGPLEIRSAFKVPGAGRMDGDFSAVERRKLALFVESIIPDASEQPLAYPVAAAIEPVLVLDPLVKGGNILKQPEIIF
jgi:hypothetical protein